MRRLSRAAAFCLIVIAALAITVLATSYSTSAQSQGRAGLVVVHGDGRESFALVQFEGESISAVEVLDRSGLEVTELNFGALGMGVCAIEGTGCDIATCRQRVCQGPKPDDPFWKLFIRTNDGGWQPAPLGISSETLTDGDVRALVWTGTGTDIPAYSIDEVASRAGAIGDNGVALTRYDADGQLSAPDSDSDRSLPVAGLAAAALAAALAIGLVVRRQVVNR